MFDNKYPIVLEDDIENIQSYYKINIDIIDNNSQKAIDALESLKKLKPQTQLQQNQQNFYNNKTPTLVLTKNNKYNKTLYIFKNGQNYYTILQNDKVALLDNTSTIFDNIIQIEPLQKGGTTQKEQIENIMNQSILDNLLKKPNPEKEKEKEIVLNNTLAYIVPIKLELYEGTDVPISKKVSINCEENYNNIQKAWKVLFKIKDDEKINK